MEEQSTILLILETIAVWGGIALVIAVIRYSYVLGTRAGKQSALEELYSEPSNFAFPVCSECSGELVTIRGFGFRIPSVFIDSRIKAVRCVKCKGVYVLKEWSKFQVVLFSRDESKEILMNEVTDFQRGDYPT